jgi:hypothetical protein
MLLTAGKTHPPGNCPSLRVYKKKKGSHVKIEISTIDRKRHENRFRRDCRYFI